MMVRGKGSGGMAGRGGSRDEVAKNSRMKWLRERACGRGGCSGETKRQRRCGKGWAAEVGGGKGWDVKGRPDGKATCGGVGRIRVSERSGRRGGWRGEAARGEAGREMSGEDGDAEETLLWRCCKEDAEKIGW